MRNLPNKRVLITGAGSGLGKSLALLFAKNGWRVACTDRDAVTAAATLKELEAAGGKGFAAALDVTSDASFTSVVERLQQDWGGLDVLINNAGVASGGTVEDAPQAQWDWVMNINFYGCLRGARAVIPLMKAQNGGHIVNVASFAGIANPPAMASYNVAKAAVVSLSETLRFELFPNGIGVSVVCPEFFKTNLLATSQSSAPNGSPGTSPQIEKIVGRLMDKATITADHVAADIYDAVQNNRFMVIPHPEARQRYHFKRFFPELFFKTAQKATVKFLQKQSARSA